MRGAEVGVVAVRDVVTLGEEAEDFRADRAAVDVLGRGGRGGRTGMAPFASLSSSPESVIAARIGVASGGSGDVGKASFSGALPVMDGWRAGGLPSSVSCSALGMPSASELCSVMSSDGAYRSRESSRGSSCVVAILVMEGRETAGGRAGTRLASVEVALMPPRVGCGFGGGGRARAAWGIVPIGEAACALDE